MGDHVEEAREKKEGLVPSNTEVKARLRDPERLRQRAAQRAGSQGELLHQVDTFFHMPHGRLKLREEAPGQVVVQFGGARLKPAPQFPPNCTTTPGQSELIYYRRP